MQMAAIDIVFGCIVAKQTQVKKIGRARQKFERCKVSFVERSRVGPDPADTVLFRQPNKLGPMPAGVAKFNGKPEIPRQSHEEFAECMFAILRCQRRRELNKDYLKLGREWFHCAEKRHQLCCAISETTNMGDLAGKLAGKPKTGGSRFCPATNRCFGRRSVKCRIDFDRGKMARIKFEPARLWQIKWIKDTTPILKAPRARANANFLLVKQIQIESRKYSVLSVGKDVTLGEEIALRI